VVDEWFQDSASQKMEGFFLDSSSLMYRFLRPQAVQQVLRDHMSNKTDNYKILSSLVIFEQWLRSISGRME